jgi:cobalt/nickel transport system permease protein
MRFSFDSLPAPQSPIARIDARWKLAALCLAATGVAFLHTLPAASAAFVGAVLLAGVARLPWRWYVSRLGAAAVFLILISVFLPFALAAQLCLKTLAILSLMMVLLASGPLESTLKAAHALRVPGLLIQLGLLTFRYIFVFAAELARLRIAMRVRGYRNRANRHSYRTVGRVAGTLLVRGYERAERVGQAMRCRGFDGHFRALAEFRTTWVDFGFFLIVVGTALGLLLWEFVLRDAMRVAV